ncbi:hypothetical protein FLONG3_6717 [Fusarium longipes]|uniref:UBC core domain-containing protein n=1 Tax=Fusarium longipes TaxID=694270 RepID=A0A395SKV2_9HYPO|nr:hypothetical protein FLONG3_6717 [Fusarium longipes]
MGIKQFNNDVQAAQYAASKSFPCVSNIRKGDSDGEIAFAYTHTTEDGTKLPPINTQALSTEPEAYPRHPKFLIFTSSEEPSELAEWLQEISALTEGKSVPDVVALISKALAKKLDSSDQLHSQIDGVSSDDDGSAFDDNEESYYDAQFDDPMEIDTPLPTRVSSNNQTPSTSTASMSRLKRHLREARREGFHVWVPPEGRGHDAFHIFSLSIHASLLSVPEDALGAWGLKSSEYVVMLFRLPSGYPSLSTFFQLPYDQATVQFSVGKCVNPNPSYASAARVFEHGSQEILEEATQNGEEPASPFLSLYMSLSLDTLLNKEFPHLLQLRQSEEISWDQAQELHVKLGRGNHQPSHAPQSANADLSQGQDKGSDRFELEFLQRDYVPKDAEDLNLILYAMQFGLQRLVKCTKYCLVCHQRIEGGVKAIKPFVCKDPLCLFQYLSLGFCQSIEYEITNNPNIVDLLVSFFYAAASNNLLREFPKGLGLKCALSGFIPSDSRPITADVCFQSNSLRFTSPDYAQYSSIKEGKCITLLLVNPFLTPQLPFMQGNIIKHICVIDSCIFTDFTFKIISTRTAIRFPTQPDNRPFEATDPKPAWEKVLVYKHEQDMDELGTSERNQALTIMSECIPPVQEMREYLIKRPGCQLSSWNRMDTSMLSLLKWIVASNRSSIVQDAPITGLSRTEGEAHHGNDLVAGMSPGWVQFRFVQGSPEKEEAFSRELMEIDSKKKPYPTLFAWHGSALGNWHSIIRTGLDFSMTVNGRAYGHGVYFAENFETSQGYSGHGGNVWPQSALKITNAVSLCELVNKTADFVSTSPFFVVNQVNWIQCRYLFLQVDNSLTESTTSHQPSHVLGGRGQLTDSVPFDAQSSSYIKQDPAHTLTSGRQRVEIPQSAIPISRRHMLGQKQICTTGSSQQFPVVSFGNNENIESNSDLDDLLASDDEDEMQPVIARKRRRTSIDSGLGETRLLENSWQPHNVTPFQPGQLDLSSLPKIAEPTWAASSPAALRALNSQIKDLQKIQSETNIAMLGWYINFEKLDNLFRWVVELHSFDMDLALARDMIDYECPSIVIEVRFGASFPITPPFVRVIRPRFLPFAQGGGGHVTMGGSICSELLTNSGWSPALSLEKVFLEVRMNLCERDPPARIERIRRTRSMQGNGSKRDYSMFEALDAYRRAATAHGWQIPSDLEMLNTM